MALTVGEIKELLEDLDDDIEIRMALQPQWPMEYAINNVIVVDLEERQDAEPVSVVYLVEERQIGYLPKAAERQIIW